MKDAAILSGAESLLALASGGINAQDDKDSDVVSLGGGEDDMEELYASRMHFGDVSGDPKFDAFNVLYYDLMYYITMAQLS